MGALGWSYDDYCTCPFGYLLIAYRGHFKAQENSKRIQYEASRFVAWASLRPHVENNREFAVTDVVKFSWEEETDTNISATEELIMQLRAEGLIKD